MSGAVAVVKDIETVFYRDLIAIREDMASALEDCGFILRKEQAQKSGNTKTPRA